MKKIEERSTQVKEALVEGGFEQEKRDTERKRLFCFGYHLGGKFVEDVRCHTLHRQIDIFLPHK